MGKFKFRLQSVLDYRGIIEEQKKTEYGRALHERNRIKEDIHICKSEIERVMDSTREASSGVINSEDLMMNYHYLNYKKNELNSYKNSLVEQEMIVNNKKSEMVDAITKKKSVQILKDQGFYMHKKKMRKQEQKGNDQLTSYKYSITS